jgi:hypothetical protein
MLAPEFGALRPWELELLTPDEEEQLIARKRELDR